MNKNKRIFSVALIFLSFFAFSNLGMAFIPEMRSWERLATTFENGVWIVDEECTGIGEICFKDDFRSLIINPQVQ